MTNPSLNAIKQPRTAFACDTETFKKKLKDMIGTTRGAYHRYAPRATKYMVTMISILFYSFCKLEIH